MPTQELPTCCLIMHRSVRFLCTSLSLLPNTEIFTSQALGQVLPWFCRTCCGGVSMITGIRASSELALVRGRVKQSKWVRVLTSLVPSMMLVYRRSRTLSSGVGWQSRDTSGFFSAGESCSRLSLCVLSVKRTAQAPERCNHL